MGYRLSDNIRCRIKTAAWQPFRPPGRLTAAYCAPTSAAEIANVASPTRLKLVRYRRNDSRPLPPCRSASHVTTWPRPEREVNGVPHGTPKPVTCCIYPRIGRRESEFSAALSVIRLATRNTGLAKIKCLLKQLLAKLPDRVMPLPKVPVSVNFRRFRSSWPQKRLLGRGGSWPCSVPSDKDESGRAPMNLPGFSY